VIKTCECNIKYEYIGFSFSLSFFYVLYSILLHLPPLNFLLSEDAGIEPGTVATLAVRRCNHSARI
jgi:hypothetical protein